MSARLDALDAAVDSEARRMLVAEAMEAFEAAFAAAGAAHVPYDEMLRSIAQEHLLVRRDDLGDILYAKACRVALPVATPDTPPSGNAAIFGPRGEGLRIAMTEGRARPGSLLSIIAFDPTGLDVHHAPDMGAGIQRPDRTYVRSVRNDIPEGNIRYLILRIPQHLFPGSPSADDVIVNPEDERAPAYVLRGYRFPPQAPAAAAA